MPNVEIPYWHPVIVHFPIALLIFGAGMAAVYAVVGRAFWRGVTLLAFAAGTLGAWAAVWTGEAIYEGVEGTPIVEALVETHEEFGEWALWLGVATTLVLVGVTVWARHTKRDAADPVAVRLIVLALALAAAGLVARAGHLGGTMVWGVAG
ncbi:MAG: DUF2231 domain-containing protein [Rhodothermales bacterium]